MSEVQVHGSLRCGEQVERNFMAESQETTYRSTLPGYSGATLPCLPRTPCQQLTLQDPQNCHGRPVGFYKLSQHTEKAASYPTHRET